MTLLALRTVLEKLDQGQGSVWRALRMQLRFFGNNQVRSAGTVGGSICTADPLGDLVPVLVAAGATVTLARWGLAKCEREQRSMLVEHFITGPKSTALSSDEFLVSVNIPSRRNAVYESYKHAKRRVDAQAVANAGFFIELDGQKIQDARLVFGATTRRSGYRCHAAEDLMIGRSLDLVERGTTDPPLLQQVLAAVAADPEVVADRTASYERVLVANFIRRFYWSVCSRIMGSMFPLQLRGGTARYPRRQTHRGTRAVVPPADSSPETVTPELSSTPHLSLQDHVSGASQFVADRPILPRTLHAALVLSRCAHGIVTRIGKDDDDSQQILRRGLMHLGMALSADDARHVVASTRLAVLWQDAVPGSNVLGTGGSLDEPLFAGKVGEEVCFYGQVMGIVVSTSADTSRAVADYVGRHEIDYDPLPALSSVDEAIAAESFFDFQGVSERVLERGDVVNELKRLSECGEGVVVVRGIARTGGQEHMYIEPQVVTATPESGGVVLWAASQHPKLMAWAASVALGLPLHCVEAKVDRIGGGFGGKQDRPQFLGAAAAVAAMRFESPVRLELERDVDMQITGQRSEFRAEYVIALESIDGSSTASGDQVPSGVRIRALDVNLYVNGGWSRDLSLAVMEVALFSIDGVYNIPHFRARGRVTRTNRVSATAFRGFGKPEATLMLESMVERASRVLGLQDPTLSVRAHSVLNDGKCPWNLVRCWEALMPKYTALRKEVDSFNSQSFMRKQGLAMIPVRTNIGFELNSMNQGGCALVVYPDGSILLHHGGTEMGQGLNTKLASIVIRTLRAELPELASDPTLVISSVRVAATSTSTIPNVPPTAAVSGTDLNGLACIDAAKSLATRLRPLMSAAAGKPLSWPDLVTLAVQERVPLHVSGSAALPRFVYDWDKKEGDWSFYTTYGVALAVVDVSVMTGSFRTLRVDIVQDAGRSLNSVVDIGQIEGGFMQGVGLSMLEDLVWAKDGHLRTRNVSTYKIPTHDDVPLQFNVSLLGYAEGPGQGADVPSIPAASRGTAAVPSRTQAGVFGARAVGESGVSLGAVVYVASLDAVAAARRARGWPSLPSHGRDYRSPLTASQLCLSMNEE